MDDTLAMQDTNERATNGPTTVTKEAPRSSTSLAEELLSQQLQQHAALQLDQQQQQQLLLQQQQQQLCGVDEQQLLLALGNPARPASSPRSPQQQQAFDASSIASDGSQDLSGMRAHVAPRRNYSSVDVDAAKHAALSALAGLDMTTTRANLDASKAAAATARANGEIPTHVRKSNLRSVSCRQLGTTGSSALPGTGGVPGTALLSGGTGATLVPGGVGKTVAFDDAASKVRPADGSAVKTVQWRTGTTTLDASGQPLRPTRAPASRCISLPHVLQGRAGMASRLAASYAADPGLAQQFQLLDGGASNHTHPLVAPGLAHMTAGAMPQMDVLSMYQLQHAAAAAGNNQLLGQRPFGTNTSMLTSTMDDSMLGQVRSGGLMMPGQHMHAQLQQQVQVQQLQQQQQQAALAGNWSAAHQQQVQQQQVAWAPGAGQVPVAGAALTNQQLLVQLQQQGAAVAGSGAGNEGLWLQAPAMSAAMQMPAGGAGRSTGLMLSGGAGGQQGMATPHLQQAFGGAALGGAGSSSGGGTFQALLDQYQQVSWALLAAAQTEGTIREQLLTEVVLQLTMLHTLSGVLQSSLTPSDAITDFEYLGSAARRHMATFNRLSQAGDIAVQQLAMIAPLACRHLGSPELLDAAFLALDTLALANRDVAGVVVQQRLTALTSLTLQLPVEQLLQQQTLALAWINGMAAVVGRNKQLLESFASANVAGAGQPMVSAAPGTATLLQAPQLSGGGGGMLQMGGVGLAAVSQPMMMSPTGTPGLSPTGKTPLATYFEENPQIPSLVSPSGGGGGAAAPPGIGAPGLAAAPGGVGHLAAGVQPDALLPDGLRGLGLGARTGAAGPAAATLAGLSNLSLGTSPAQAPAAGAAAPGSGLSLFGGGHVSGSSQGGGPTGVVGVQ